MCTFCEKIYPNKDCHDIVFALGKYSELKYDPMDRFITIDENGEYDLNVIPDDPYELGFFPDVKFCPYCGRNLTENAEQEQEDVEDDTPYETGTIICDSCGIEIAFCPCCGAELEGGKG